MIRITFEWTEILALLVVYLVVVVVKAWIYKFTYDKKDEK